MKRDLEDIITWALNAGLFVTFSKIKSVGITGYQATFVGLMGRRQHTYQVTEGNIGRMIDRIKHQYREIFVELQCPPMSGIPEEDKEDETF